MLSSSAALGRSQRLTSLQLCGESPSAHTASGGGKSVGSPGTATTWIRPMLSRGPPKHWRQATGAKRRLFLRRAGADITPKFPPGLESPEGDRSGAQKGHDGG